MDVRPETLKRAKALRRAMTPPEARLWNALRAWRLDGLKFRRQHPFGPYILDFYYDAAKLAVEVDGAGHDVDDQPMRDARRDGYLKRRGVRTLRIRALDVGRDLNAVLDDILHAARDEG